MPVPRCSALRRDGQPCGALASSPGAVYRRHHERLVEAHGEYAVREGRYPRKRNPKTEVAAVAEPPTNVAEGETSGRNVVVALSPSDVRPALAQAAAASLDELQQALLEAALGAARERWATFTCPTAARSTGLR